MTEEVSIFPAFDENETCVHIKLPDILIYYIFDLNGDIVFMDATPRDSDSCSCGLKKCQKCSENPHNKNEWFGVVAYNPSMQRVKSPGPPGMPPGYDWYWRVGMFVLMGGTREEMRCHICGGELTSFKSKIEPLAKLTPIKT